MAWRKPANLNEWFGIVVRHKKKFFFPAIVVMIAVIWASQWFPREYEAEAKFQRKSEMTYKSDQMGEALSKMRALMNYNFRGRPAIEQLIKDLRLTEGMAHTADGQLTTDGMMLYNELVNELANSVSVSSQVATESLDLISVSFTHRDRDLVSKVVNRLVENYIQTVRTEIDQTLMDQKKFFDKEVARYREKVSKMEEAKLRFTLSQNGLLPDDPIFFYNKLEQLKRDRETSKAEYEKAKGALEALIKWEKEQPDVVETTSTEENEELRALKDKLFRLNEALEVNIYEFRRTEEHPAVKDLRRRVVETGKQIRDFEGGDKLNIEEEPNAEKIAAQKDIATQTAELEAMAKTQEELAAEVERFEIANRNFFTVRNEYLKIVRELDDSMDQLRFWDDNLRRTQMALTVSVSDGGMRLSVMQRAPDNVAKPSSPTLFKILAAAVALGLASGVLMIVLAELLDHSYRSVEQAIDEIKLPVLGAINEIVSPAAAMRRKIFGWGVLPMVTTVLALMLGGVLMVSYLSLEKPHKYDQLKENPVNFISNYFSGR